jgi:hypothetical protein
MRKFNRLTAAAAIVFAAAATLRADVLEKVPDNALVAVKVAALETTSGKIAKLAKDFGVDGFLPMAADPLAGLQQQANITKGLNKAGDLAFVYMDPKAAQTDDTDKSILILIPVSSFAEFLGNFEGAKTDAGVSEVTFAGDEEPSFVADWGGYAAVSPLKNLVGKPGGTLKVAGVSAKQAQAQDFLVYTNFAKLGPDLLPELEKGATKALAEIDGQENAQVDAKYKPLIKTTLNQFFGVARTFLKETNSATIGLNIADAGINTTVLADFKEGSYLGKFASGLKGTDKPLTIGLPKLRYLAYGGAAYDPQTVSKVVDDLSAPILADLGKIEGQDDAKQLAANFKAALGKNSGWSQGLVAPTKIGDDAFLQQIAVYRGGGKEMATAMDSTGTFAKSLIASVEPKEGEPKPTVAFTPAARTVDGVAFNSMKFDMEQPKDSPQAMQVERMMTIFYGAQGNNVSYAAVGNDLVMANAAKDESISALLKSSKANENNLAKLEQVQAVTAELPKMRVYEMYVALDEIVNAGVAVAGEFGFPVQMQLPPELPPLGAAFGTEGNAFRFDVHLPRTTIQSIIAAGMQAAMQMQGGGGGGGAM